MKLILLFIRNPKHCLMESQRRTCFASSLVCYLSVVFAFFLTPLTSNLKSQPEQVINHGPFIFSLENHFYCFLDTWDCRTRDHQWCSFPFKYNGTSHFGCIRNITGTNGAMSCAINSNPTKNLKSHGFCNKDCPYGKHLFDIVST